MKGKAYMTCPNCEHSIEVGDTICPVCRTRVAQLAQEAKVNELTLKIGAVCLEGFKGRMFLVYSIFLSVITAFALADVVSGIVRFDFSNILDIAASSAIAVFTLVSAVAAWRIYFSPYEAIESRSVRGLTVYPRVQIVINIVKSAIYGVTMIPLGAVLIFSSFYVSGSAERMEQMESLLKLLGAENMYGTMNGIFNAYTHVMGIDLVSIGLLAIAVCMARVVMMSRLRRYVNMIAGVAEGDEFKRYVKLPLVLLWAFGTVAFVGGVLDALTDPIGALLKLSTAGYLAVSAIMFKNTADEMDYSIRKLEEEKKLLISITENSDKLLSETEDEQ